MDQLQALATDLINRKVAVDRCGWRKQYRSGRQIAHVDDPIVFTSGLDPVEAELVTSLNPRKRMLPG